MSLCDVRLPFTMPVRYGIGAPELYQDNAARVVVPRRLVNLPSWLERVIRDLNPTKASAHLKAEIDSLMKETEDCLEEIDVSAKVWS